MNKIYNFDINKFNFHNLVGNLFQNELSNLHNKKKNKYELFTEVGKDSSTEFHNIFYQKLNSDWLEIHNLYDQFLKDIKGFYKLEKVSNSQIFIKKMSYYK